MEGDKTGGEQPECSLEVLEGLISEAKNEESQHESQNNLAMSSPLDLSMKTSSSTQPGIPLASKLSGGIFILPDLSFEDKNSSPNASSSTQDDSKFQNPANLAPSSGLPLVYETTPSMISHPFTSSTVSAVYKSFLLPPSSIRAVSNCGSMPNTPVMGAATPFMPQHSQFSFDFPMMTSHGVNLFGTSPGRDAPVVHQWSTREFVKPMFTSSQFQKSEEGRKGKKFVTSIAPAESIGKAPPLPPSSSMTGENQRDSFSNVNKPSSPERAKSRSSEQDVPEVDHQKLSRQAANTRYRAKKKAEQESIVRRVALLEEENIRLRLAVSAAKAERDNLLTLVNQRR